MKTNLDKIVCPGCGRIGPTKRGVDYSVCPECDYEIDAFCDGALTLAKMIERGDIRYNDVDLPAFLRGVLLAVGVIEK